MKRIIPHVFLVFLYLCSFVPIVAGAQIRVPGDYPTVQAAAAVVREGDTILIAPDAVPGEGYSDLSRIEFLVGVTLQGSGVMSTTLKISDYVCGINLAADESHLRDLTLIVDGQPRMKQAIICCQENSSIQNVLVKGNFNTGLTLAAEKHSIVNGVTIIGGDFAGMSVSANDPNSFLEIRDCVIEGSGTGLYLNGYDAPVNADYLLISNCEENYTSWHTPGPHDKIGEARLNACGVPMFGSDALGMAADGSDVGAIQFDWDVATADFDLTLSGGLLRGEDPDVWYFSAGDQFSLDWYLNHDICGGVPIDLYVLLDVYGAYYFFPSWTRALDQLPITVPAGGYTENIFSFEWPEGVGPFAPLPFYGVGFQQGTLSPATMVTPIGLVYITGE